VQVAIAPKTAKPKKRRGASVELDASAMPEAEALFEALRSLRKTLADQQGVPPYVVFSDASLKQMAERQPLTSTAFLDISGVGSRKLAQYGAAFTAAIRAFLVDKGLSVPAAPAEDAAAFVVDEKQIVDEDLPDTVVVSQRLFEQGLELDEIAAKRGLDAATIAGHLEALFAHGVPLELSRLVPADRVQTIASALQAHGEARLRPAWEALGSGVYSYEELRLVRAWRHGQKRAG
jgi:ATP-dependent DNA helicase RecQ